MRRPREQFPVTPKTALFISIAAPPSELYKGNPKNGLDRLMSHEKPKFVDASSSSGSDMPVLGKDGVYKVKNQAQHAALLKAHDEKIVILKCFAPWCRACKGLAPKFLQIRNDARYKELPIVWAELSVQDNKEFIESLGVEVLPTVQFYVAGQRQDSFACGPSKVRTLKRKLALLANQHIDTKTLQLKKEYLQKGPQTRQQQQQQYAPSATTAAVEKGDPSAKVSAATAVAPKMTEEERQLYTSAIPYLKELPLTDLDALLDRAKLKTFAIGDIIVREGDENSRELYVLRTGQVEISQAMLGFHDPLVAAAPNFFGTVINRLEEPGDHFGERALFTGEPMAASIRAASQVTCWVLDRDDFPASSVLSGRGRLTAFDASAALDDKYGVSLQSLSSKWLDQQQTGANRANQVRGSFNTPGRIRGIDYDYGEVVDEEDLILQQEEMFQQEEAAAQQQNFVKYGLV